MFYKPARTRLTARLPFVDLRVALRGLFFATPAFFATPVFFATIEFSPAVAALASCLPLTEAGATFSGVGTNPEVCASSRGVAAEDSPLLLLPPLFEFGFVSFIAEPVVAVKARLERAARAFTAFLATETFLPLTLFARAARMEVAFFARAALLAEMFLVRAERTDAAFFATPTRFAETDLLRAALTRDFTAAEAAFEEFFNGAA
jgi:hypothetical protein